jgi:hypothetical protein
LNINAACIVPRLALLDVKDNASVIARVAILDIESVACIFPQIAVLDAEIIASISRWLRFAKPTASRIDTTGNHALRAPILKGSNEAL